MKAIDFIAPRVVRRTSYSARRTEKEARRSCRRARIGPSMEVSMLGSAHDSHKPEPTIAMIRPLRNSARQTGAYLRSVWFSRAFFCGLIDQGPPGGPSPSPGAWLARFSSAASSRADRRPSHGRSWPCQLEGTRFSMSATFLRVPGSSHRALSQGSTSGPSAATMNTDP